MTKTFVKVTAAAVLLACLAAVSNADDCTDPDTVWYAAEQKCISTDECKAIAAAYISEGSGVCSFCDTDTQVANKAQTGCTTATLCESDNGHVVNYICKDCVLGCSACEADGTTCTACESGYRKNGNTCVACTILNCAVCAIDTGTNTETCSQCAADHQLYTTVGYQCDTEYICRGYGNNKYAITDNGKCVSSTECLTAYGAGETGQMLDTDGHCYSAKTCAEAPGYITTENKCQKCVGKENTVCQRCTNGTMCSQCKEGYMVNGIDDTDASQGTCVASCSQNELIDSAGIKHCVSSTACIKNGYNPRGGVCSPCNAGDNCAECANSKDVCSKCKTGYLMEYPDGTTCTVQQTTCTNDNTSPKIILDGKYCMAQDLCGGNVGFKQQSGSPTQDYCTSCLKDGNCATCTTADKCATCDTANNYLMLDDKSCILRANCNPQSSQLVYKQSGKADSCITLSRCANDHLGFRSDVNGNADQDGGYCTPCAPDYHCNTCQGPKKCDVCGAKIGGTLYDLLQTHNSITECIQSADCKRTEVNVGNVVMTEGLVSKCVTLDECTNNGGYYDTEDQTKNTCNKCGNYNCATCSSSTGCSSCKGTQDQMNMDSHYCIEATACPSTMYLAAGDQTLGKSLGQEGVKNLCVNYDDCNKYAHYTIKDDTTCYPCNQALNCKKCSISNDKAVQQCTECEADNGNAEDKYLKLLTTGVNGAYYECITLAKCRELYNDQRMDVDGVCAAIGQCKVDGNELETPEEAEKLNYRCPKSCKTGMNCKTCNSTGMCIGCADKDDNYVRFQTGVCDQRDNCDLTAAGVYVLDGLYCMDGPKTTVTPNVPVPTCEDYPGYLTTKDDPRQCTSCPKGFGCEKCSGQSTCTKCHDNQYLIDDTPTSGTIGSCVLNCAEHGLYQQSDSADPSSQEKKCISASKCVSKSGNPKKVDETTDWQCVPCKPEFNCLECQKDQEKCSKCNKDDQLHSVLNLNEDDKECISQSTCSQYTGESGQKYVHTIYSDNKFYGYECTTEAKCKLGHAYTTDATTAAGINTCTDCKPDANCNQCTDSDTCSECFADDAEHHIINYPALQTETAVDGDNVPLGQCTSVAYCNALETKYVYSPAGKSPRCYQKEKCEKAPGYPDAKTADHVCKACPDCGSCTESATSCTSCIQSKVLVNEKFNMDQTQTQTQTQPQTCSGSCSQYVYERPASVCAEGQTSCTQNICINQATCLAIPGYTTGDAGSGKCIACDTNQHCKSCDVNGCSSCFANGDKEWDDVTFTSEDEYLRYNQVKGKYECVPKSDCVETNLQDNVAHVKYTDSNSKRWCIPKTQCLQGCTETGLQCIDKLPGFVVNSVCQNCHENWNCYRCDNAEQCSECGTDEVFDLTSTKCISESECWGNKGSKYNYFVSTYTAVAGQGSPNQCLTESECTSNYGNANEKTVGKPACNPCTRSPCDKCVKEEVTCSKCPDGTPQVDQQTGNCISGADCIKDNHGYMQETQTETEPKQCVQKSTCEKNGYIDGNYCIYCDTTLHCKQCDKDHACLGGCTETTETKYQPLYDSVDRASDITTQTIYSKCIEKSLCTTIDTISYVFDLVGDSTTDGRCIKAAACGTAAYGTVISSTTPKTCHHCLTSQNCGECQFVSDEDSCKSCKTGSTEGDYWKTSEKLECISYDDCIAKTDDGGLQHYVIQNNDYCSSTCSGAKDDESNPTHCNECNEAWQCQQCSLHSCIQCPTDKVYHEPLVVGEENYKCSPATACTGQTAPAGDFYVLLDEHDCILKSVCDGNPRRYQYYGGSCHTCNNYLQRQCAYCTKDKYCGECDPALADYSIMQVDEERCISESDCYKLNDNVVDDNQYVVRTDNSDSEKYKSCIKKLGCVEGYYLDEATMANGKYTKCLPCRDGQYCATCTNGTSCATCSSYQTEVSGVTVNINRYLQPNSWLKPDNGWKCDSETRCRTGTTLSGSPFQGKTMIPLKSKYLCLAEDACESNGYVSTDKEKLHWCNACPESMQCADCDAPCTDDADDKCTDNVAYCTDCPIDYYFDHTENTLWTDKVSCVSMQQCHAKKDSTGQAYTTSDGKQECITKRRCEVDEPIGVAVSVGSDKWICYDCVENGNCGACAAGGDHQCTKCKDGYLLTDNKYCVQIQNCRDKTQMNTEYLGKPDSVISEEKQLQYVPYEKTCILKSDCDGIGKYYDETDDTCQPCDDECYSCSKDNTCETCSAPIKSGEDLAARKVLDRVGDRGCITEAVCKEIVVDDTATPAVLAVVRDDTYCIKPSDCVKSTGFLDEDAQTCSSCPVSQYCDTCSEKGVCQKCSGRWTEDRALMTLNNTCVSLGECVGNNSLTYNSTIVKSDPQCLTMPQCKKIGFPTFNKEYEKYGNVFCQDCDESSHCLTCMSEKICTSCDNQTEAKYPLWDTKGRMCRSEAECISDSINRIAYMDNKSCIFEEECPGYIENKHCYKCNEGYNCLTCEIGGKCATCELHSYLLVPDMKCISETEYFSEGLQIQLDSDGTQLKCIKPANCQNSDVYPSFLADDSQSCFSCKSDFNCATCSDTDKCDTCPTGQYMLLPEMKCVSECTGEYITVDDGSTVLQCVAKTDCATAVPGYEQNGVCIKCDQTCKTCETSKDHCTSCDSTKYALSIESNTCILDGECVWNEDELLSKAIFFDKDGAKYCILYGSCSGRGAFIDSTGKCVLCTSTLKCEQCSNATSCTSCPVNYALDTTVPEKAKCISRNDCNSGKLLLFYGTDHEQCILKDACKESVGYPFGGYCANCKEGGNCGTCTIDSNGDCTSCQNSEDVISGLTGTDGGCINKVNDCLGKKMTIKVNEVDTEVTANVVLDEQKDYAKCIPRESCREKVGQLPTETSSACVSCPSGKNCASCSQESGIKCLSCEENYVVFDAESNTESENYGKCVQESLCVSPYYIQVMIDGVKHCILETTCTGAYGYPYTDPDTGAKSCKRCIEGCDSCETEDACLTCPDGNVLIDGKCVADQNCKSNKDNAVLDGKTCIVGSTCVEKVPGYWNKDAQECTSCPTNNHCSKCEVDVNMCSECQTAQSYPSMVMDSADPENGHCITEYGCAQKSGHLIMADQYKCVTTEYCTEQGYVVDTARSKCTACDTTYCKQCASATTCQKCQVGSLLDTESSTCKPKDQCSKYVKDDEYCVDEKECIHTYMVEAAKTCDTCKYNCGVCDKDLECISCDTFGDYPIMSEDKKSCLKKEECYQTAGYVFNYNYDCIKKENCVGYLDDTTTPHECRACNAKLNCETCQQYSVCLTCAPGYALVKDGNSAQCKACDDSKYCPGGSEPEQKCGLCQTCDNSAASAGTCKTCGEGKKGATCETDCAIGEYCPANRADNPALYCSAECASCNSQSVFPSSCLTCASGYKKSDTNSTVCVACAHNEICTKGVLEALCNSTCYKCTGDADNQCQSCYAHFHVDATGKCVHCPTNFDSDDDAISCTPVPSSEFVVVKSDDGGLSTGAVAAIAIVCTLVVAAVVVVLLWLFVFKPAAAATASGGDAGDAGDADEPEAADEDGVQMDDMKNDDADADDDSAL